jgi:ubiquinone/menaquinone biosynthesis C-methylase UbiE
LPINRHFDLLAPLYDRLIAPPDPDRLRALLDLPDLHAPPAAGWMLDAGGGTGRVSAELCARVERLAISDLSLAMLRQAVEKGRVQPRLASVQPVLARVQRLPFPDGCFTRILVVDAFHHFGRQPESAAELERVLAPGGRLVIEEPDIRRLSVKLIALGETLALMGSRFRSPEWMRAQLAGLGLQARVETDQATAWIIASKNA